ncbi:cytochrome c/c1 heme-lyase [Phakopsora pachyrhizi]|uniref:Holocytochrome c-type synthase n=1 Tax=Phakopsora pachyrhizi TaxID=170000 RepID=A0AAV0BJV9_PHAPC|nr:cytochrome c/c1 heme-lyase [Phakopsora pachyrhizi]CAH7686862.1 cytochrome c/c1 heme-lyase [Phakopsora pachyrhizi]
MGSSLSNLNSSPDLRDDHHDRAVREESRGLSSSSSSCPMRKVEESGQTMNPLNNIPLSISQDSSPEQLNNLSRERTRSSIPQSNKLTISSNQLQQPSSCPIRDGKVVAIDDDDKTWVYPSPQQFHNALLRKGWQTPVESVPMMVEIHNWMNEAVWQEVLRWEKRYFSDNLPPSNYSSATTAVDRRGDVNQPVEDSTIALGNCAVSLARFRGRPDDLSPKARYHILLGRLFPWIYSSQRPFDRHDWMISRDFVKSGGGGGDADGISEDGRLHRYVIDYYSGADDENGNPAFHFDVRPAIDDFRSLSVRIREWARRKNENWLEGQRSDTIEDTNKSDN